MGSPCTRDAVQAAGRVPIDMRALGVDYLTLSAHKLGGPKGVGALVVRDGASLPAFIAGGGQERRRRAGTENVAAIAGFGAAAEAARQRPRQNGEGSGLARPAGGRGSRAYAGGRCHCRSRQIACPTRRTWRLPGASAETLVIALDLKGIAVSAGAACSSGKVGASHVLAAMGLAPDIARAAIRISLGPGLDGARHRSLSRRMG